MPNRFIKKIPIFIIMGLFPTLSFGHIILIDPGHGGEDLGAIAKKNIYEKDIALSISKKIMQRLKQQHTVFLTRSVDRTIGLHERADMAERLKADLFISVHINSGIQSSSHGFETYYLDNHEDKAVKKVEGIENKNQSNGDVVINHILADLVIQQTVPTSKGLAQSIHQQIKQKVGGKFKMADRGIRPGLFFVLALSKRPGVLLEAGFLSNQKELGKLTSNQFQNAYAEAVALGIEGYLQKNKKGDVPLL